jgi:hypothetical protein
VSDLLTARERQIIRAALPSSEGTVYQPAQEDLGVANDLISRGLLVKREGWDCLDATPEASEMYWADMDDIEERRHQARMANGAMLDEVEFWAETTGEQQ